MQGTWDPSAWLQLNTCRVSGLNWKRRFCWCRFNDMIRSSAGWWLFLNWWCLSSSFENWEGRGDEAWFPASGATLQEGRHTGCISSPIRHNLRQDLGWITHQKGLLTALLHPDYSTITCVYMLKSSEVGATWVRNHLLLHPRQLRNPPPYCSFFNPPMTLIWEVYMQSADFGKLIR